MKLIQREKILECDEIEEEIHNREIVELMEKLSNLGNIECAIIEKYQDILNKDTNQKIFNLSIQDLSSLFEMYDCKNGADIYLDDEFLVLMIYGQNYLYDGLDEMTTVALKILPFNAEREFLDLSDYIKDDGNIKIAKTQFD